jgi:hypothetical protein
MNAARQVHSACAEAWVNPLTMPLMPAMRPLSSNSSRYSGQDSAKQRGQPRMHVPLMSTAGKSGEQT